MGIRVTTYNVDITDFNDLVRDSVRKRFPIDGEMHIRYIIGTIYDVVTEVEIKFVEEA